MKGNKQRHKIAQRAELKEWEKSKRDFDSVGVLRELELLGINPLEVKGKVLDIGGGYGHFASLFSNALERVVADPLYEKIGISIENIAGVSCAGENLPFSSDSFDFVILRNVIDHMLEPGKLLIEAYRVLKPGGKIYFMVNIFRSFIKPLFGLMGRLDKPHPLHFTLYDIRRLLTTKTGGGIERERIARSGHFECNLKRIAGVLIKREYYAILCQSCA